MSLKFGHKNLGANGIAISECKISDLTRACDCLDNLHISIYLMEREQFIYSNSALKKMVGHGWGSVMNKSWESWLNYIGKDEREVVKNKLYRFFSSPFFDSTFVLKYHIVNAEGQRLFLRHEILLHHLERQTLAINYFFDITEKEKIEAYFKVSRKSETSFPESENLISPREKEVLKLVADGFSSKQIADRLFISNHTAISHRKSLIEKFNVKNTAQLIKRAYLNMELW